MSKSSAFIKLQKLSDKEISSYPATGGTLSWSGWVDHITEDDIQHLQTGKPLLLVVDGEYNVVIKLAK